MNVSRLYVHYVFVCLFACLFMHLRKCTLSFVTFKMIFIFWMDA